MKEPDGCHAGPAAWLCGGGTLLGAYSELWDSPGMQRNDWSGSPWRAVMDCFRPSDRTAAQQKLPAMGPGAVFIGGGRRRTAVHASKKKPQSNALRLPFARGHLRRVIS